VASDPPGAGRLAENLRGAGFMSASMLGFTVNDAFMKSVAGDLALAQAVFLRGLLTTLFIGALAWRQGALRLPPGRRDRRLIGVRCLAEVGGTICFLTALFNMPLANATAILQSLPLAVTLAAALVFDEPVGWQRYLAIAIGFLGVLIIVRPGTEGFNAYSLWAVAAVAFIVTRDLVTRRLSPDVPGTPVALVTSAALTLAAALAAGFEDWRAVEASSLLALGIASLCLVVGAIFSVTGMRVGEIGFVQPFRYSALLWAMVLGIVMFGEWPDAWMLVGSAIVVGTGLFTLYRERRLGLAAPG
jgi:drug/metabolite transporter (DMT)-like permease